MSQSFEQYVIATYGKSVFQIELDIASAWFVNKTSGDTNGAADAFSNASMFVNRMRSQWQRLGMRAPGEPPYGVEISTPSVRAVRE